MIPTNSPQCLYCGSSFRGRTDKKFCNENCRNAYHNNANRNNNILARDILQILYRNRRLIRDILGSNTSIKISREILLSKGFMENYHTHTGLVGSSPLFYCFECSFQACNDGQIRLGQPKPKL